MRIAIILSKPPGYSETFFRSKIQGLLNHGHQVILVTSRTEDKFDLCHHIYHPKVYKNTAAQLFMMFNVFVGLLRHFKTIQRYIALEKQDGTPFKRIVEKLYINARLLQLKVDWIHFGFATMAIDRELVAKTIGAKMAVSFRGYDINVYPIKNPKSYMLLLKNVDKVHSISNDLLQKAYKLGLSKSLPYQIITPAVNLEMLPELQSIEKPRTLKILTIARLHYIKGIDVLLETAANLYKSQIDFTWEIIGSGNDNERYLNLRLRLGLEEKVVFLGELNHQDTLRKLQETNLYVQTSLTEGFCNAALEAQALGKLTLAFDKGGLPENIIDGETGFLVNEVSAGLLANKIVEVINMQDVEKQKIKEQAIKRVKQTFGLEQQQQAFHQFYTV